MTKKEFLEFFENCSEYQAKCLGDMIKDSHNQKIKEVEENSIPNFLWLVVFILVFICALFAILEYSGIINYLSGLV